MKPNVGTIDRAIRILAGLGMITYGLLNHSWLGAIGLLPLGTGLVRWCPAYLPFGLSTCKGSAAPNVDGCGCGDDKC